MARSTVTLAIPAAIVVLLVWVAISVSEIITGHSTDTAFDLRPTLLCISLVGLSIVSYVVWPNRWNVVAHTQLAFSLIAYVIPIYLLHSLDQLSSEALDIYYQVVTVGFVMCLLGTALGAWLALSVNIGKLTRRVDFLASDVQAVISRRVFVITLMSIAGVLISFAVMGFVPAFAADPMTAKFFRGVYAAAYAPVAPIYRAATSAIALLLPLIVLYAWKKRTPLWLCAAAGSLLVMLLGLLREPAVSGLLLAVGIAFAIRGKGMLLYLLLLVGAYFVGGGLYYLLATWGVGNFGTVGQSSLLQQVAAGAPDISDHLHFLRSWLLRPEYTHGLTFVGGLIPGNFEWNPSVWSLHVVNPGASIGDIASGGLRLPAPIWGLVSFGWSGVVLVSLLNGVMIGYFAVLGKKIIPSRSIESATYWLVLYVAITEVLPVFFRLSYLSILQLVIVVALIFWRVARVRR